MTYYRLYQAHSDVSATHWAMIYKYLVGPMCERDEDPLVVSNAGDYQGRDQLFDYFATVRKLTAGTLQLHPQSIMASDDEIAMFTRVTAERPGKVLDVVLAQTLTVGPDGRWTEHWAIADDQEAVDDFWS